jgi:hypothetical protein
MSGKQKPEAFAGLPKDVIESSRVASALEQSAWLLATILTNGEEMEVDSLVWRRSGSPVATRRLLAPLR